MSASGAPRPAAPRHLETPQQVYQGAYHPTAKPATYRRKPGHDAMRRNGVSLERTASMLGNKGRWLAILALVASARVAAADASAAIAHGRSEEHTSELQSLMRISYAVFCLKKKTQ